MKNIMQKYFIVVTVFGFALGLLPVGESRVLADGGNSMPIHEKAIGNDISFRPLSAYSTAGVSAPGNSVVGLLEFYRISLSPADDRLERTRNEIAAIELDLTNQKLDPVRRSEMEARLATLESGLARADGMDIAASKTRPLGRAMLDEISRMLGLEGDVELDMEVARGQAE